MAATISEIREAFEAVISVTGLRVLGTWPDTVVGDCCVLVPVSGDFHFTFDTKAAIHHMALTVLVTVGAGLDKAQDRMDGYLSTDGATSIQQRLVTNHTLGGVIDDSLVHGYSAYGTVKTESGAEWLSARMELEFWV